MCNFTFISIIFLIALVALVLLLLLIVLIIVGTLFDDAEDPAYWILQADIRAGKYRNQRTPTKCSRRSISHACGELLERTI